MIGVVRIVSLWLGQGQNQNKYYVLFSLFILLAACSPVMSFIKPDEALAINHWNQTEVGEIKGKLTVEWIGPDEFIYIPDKDEPLTFIRKKNGQVIDVITPGKMKTNGGSIPRILWTHKDFSPWMYGPAYIIHDWLFELNHCELPGREKYDHHIAAQIMAEVMKTQLINENKDIDNLSKYTKTINYWYTIFLSVDSYSKVLWDYGSCDAIFDENSK